MSDIFITVNFVRITIIIDIHNKNKLRKTQNKNNIKLISIRYLFRLWS